MRVHHLAGAACGNAGGGQQRYVFVGFDDRHVRRFAGGDHAVGEVVMADTVEHNHVQPADALDVFGAGFVGMRVETGRNQRHHFGLVADDVGYVAVIRVQGDADAQALGLVGAGQGCQQAGQQADQCQAQNRA
ncbi:hypothetical protein D3C71_873440 [compost metagenome]